MKKLRLLVLGFVLISAGLLIADGDPPATQSRETTVDGNNCQPVIGTCDQ